MKQSMIQPLGGINFQLISDIAKHAVVQSYYLPTVELLGSLPQFSCAGSAV